MWKLAAAVLALALLLALAGGSPPQPTGAVEALQLPVVNLSELRMVTGWSAVPTALFYYAAADAAPAVAANVQVAGVDEEDYVKFDGERLYVAYRGYVYVVGPDLSVEKRLPCPSSLVCYVFAWGNSVLAYSPTEAGTVLYLYGPWGRAVYNYSGYPVSTRMRDGVVYIVAMGGVEAEINGAAVKEAPLLSLGDPPATLIVAAVDMRTGRFNAAAYVSSAVSHVYMRGNRLYIAAPLSPYDLAYEATKAVWERLPPEMRAVLDMENVYTFYKTVRGLLEWRGGEYLSYLNKANTTTATKIYVFETEGVEARLKAVFIVPGRVLDQFAVEELGDRLVVATTAAPVKFELLRPPPADPFPSVIKREGLPTQIPPPSPPPVLYAAEGEPTNAVYLYTPDGTLVVKAEGLASGERIYAARLVGSTLYLVTFRQADPLFAVDLSRGEPRVLGYLKTPGFSEYLHPVAPGKLLGVGVYGDGVKIALFDVSNPAAPREVSNITVPHSYTPIIFDHHAFAYSQGVAVVPIRLQWRQCAVLAVEVGDGLTARTLEGVCADRAFFKDGRIHLVGRGRVWLYDATFNKVGEVGLS
ncbi:beta-propeller domain-containing protein [Pyrobaculum calidifontis]|nr:beta-propeller domain-containing protein [Pyrobaculum calidifontis]